MPGRRIAEIAVVALFGAAGALLWIGHALRPHEPVVTQARRSTLKPPPPKPCDVATWPPFRSLARDQHSQRAADRHAHPSIPPAGLFLPLGRHAGARSLAGRHDRLPDSSLNVDDR